jgi:hypothetical protein
MGNSKKLSRYLKAGAKGERKYSSYSFLTSSVDGVSGQSHALAAFYPLEITPVIHWIGGWVDLRAGLDTEARGKPFASVEDQIPVVRSVVRHYAE